MIQEIVSSEYNHQSPFKKLVRDKVIKLFGKKFSSQSLGAKLTSNKKNESQKLENPTQTLNLDIEKKIKSSNQKNGRIYSFGVGSFDPLANSHNLNRVRSFDRVAIYFNSLKYTNKSSKKLPIPISYFGIYDGYENSLCSNFVKENLHKALVNSKYFPKNLTLAIKDAVKSTLNSFYKY